MVQTEAGHLIADLIAEPAGAADLGVIGFGGRVDIIGGETKVGFDFVKIIGAIEIIGALYGALNGL